MRKRSADRRLIFPAALVLALAAQILILEFLRLQAEGPGLNEARTPPREMQATVVPVPKRPPKEEPPEDELDGQVVNLREPEQEQEPPEDPEYLSKVNTKVEEETKAKPTPPDKTDRGGQAKVKEPSPVQSPRSKSPEPTKTKKQEETVELPRKQEKDKPTEVGEKPAFKELQRGKKNSLLLPSTSQDNAVANMQALSGELRSDDALLDVEREADETALSSRKFRYWDFFNRVKERVREHWSPAEIYRKRDPSGRIYGVKDRLTILTVTLDDAGKLQRLITAKDSGADFLDEEARRAFKSASPFPNPPVGLLDDGGRVTFQFGFLFEISSGRHRYFWKRL